MSLAEREELRRRLRDSKSALEEFLVEFSEAGSLELGSPNVSAQLQAARDICDAIHRLLGEH